MVYYKNSNIFHGITLMTESLFESVRQMPRGAACDATCGRDLDEKDLQRLLDGIERLKAQHAEDLASAKSSRAALTRRCSELKERVQELAQELEVQYDRASQQEDSALVNRRLCSQLQDELQLKSEEVASLQRSAHLQADKVEDMEAKIEELEAQRLDTSVRERELVEEHHILLAHADHLQLEVPP